MDYQYLIGSEEAESRAKELADSLKQNKGESDFTGFAVGVLIRRLNSKPECYREFGMYWPALKKVLNEHGANLGNDLIDDPIAEIYGHYESADAVIAAAEDFKDYYRETWFVGTNQFTIDLEGTNWTLYDEDMENKIKMMQG